MKKAFEIAHSKKECPVCDIMCPYCDMAGYCHLKHPMQDCDDYAVCHEGEEDDE